MLPDIGGTEILVIAIVALIVVGPKDLPALLRKIGAFTAKLRGMASEFRSSFDDMARHSELEELRKEVEALRHGELSQMGAEARAAVSEIEHEMAGAGIDLDVPSYQYVPSPEPEPAPKPARKPRAPKAAAGKPVTKASAAPKAAKAAPKKTAVARAKTPKAAG